MLIRPIWMQLMESSAPRYPQRPFLMGATSEVIREIKPAKQIVDEMVSEAVKCLQASQSLVKSKL